ncbi:hypothetical protein PAPYR_8847 [Paratrimastix pyriformis]|uniref:Uncharacterized protein n=1 Tax=Paratrimastix pyriformis TaxID=342808 RepID=A0ABQ8UCB8_9EUKA|nr:hypothetical protein PAPYR_8847 [Paratrimastix pyriformis]
MKIFQKSGHDLPRRDRLALSYSAQKTFSRCRMATFSRPVKGSPRCAHRSSSASAPLTCFLVPKFSILCLVHSASRAPFCPSTTAFTSIPARPTLSFAPRMYSRTPVRASAWASSWAAGSRFSCRASLAACRHSMTHVSCSILAALLPLCC